MTGFPLLAAVIIIKIVAVLFVICAVVLILVVLLQKGRGGGLSAAFAGGAAGGILGSKTGDFLTWLTIVLVSIFLILSVVLAKFYKPGISSGFDINPPAQQQPSADMEQPIEEIPSVAPDANEGGDANLSGAGQGLPNR
jgi:preprotein translocase subunit SecG